MEIKKSKENKGIIGICGHVGVGHIHSHSGFVQDDSAGLAVAATILKKSLPVDTIIESVEVDIYRSTISVKTKDGGVGEVWVSRGITPFERIMIEKSIGQDAIYSQKIVLSIFGRMYGQGAMEVAVSLQAAISLALLHTFKEKWPQDVLIVEEDISPNIGKALGTVIEIDSIPISIMLTVNASLGGMGPMEDLEGNIMLGKKGMMMKEIGLDKIPTIIIESKNFSPGNCNSLEENSFLIRANRKFDNNTVAACLVEGARETEVECIYQDDVLMRGNDDFHESVGQLGNRIIELGDEYKNSRTSRERVGIIGQLANIISEEAGGTTFMSNELQMNVGSAGMMKGTSAVISLLVTKKYIEHHKIPFVTEKDVKAYMDIIYNGIFKLYNRLDKAQRELEDKFDFKEEDYKYLFNDLY